MLEHLSTRQHLKIQTIIISIYLLIKQFTISAYSAHERRNAVSHLVQTYTYIYIYIYINTYIIFTKGSVESQGLAITHLNMASTNTWCIFRYTTSQTSALIFRQLDNIKFNRFYFLFKIEHKKTFLVGIVRS
jgi:hypothetical protein